LLVLSALLAACGDDGDDDDGDATAEPTAEATETPEPTDDNGPSPSPTQQPADTTAGMALDEFVIRPDRTRARHGTVTFVVRNDGELEHEFVVIRTDIEKDELPRKANDEGVDESDLDVVGRIDAFAPGETRELTIDVEDGQYVLVCNLFANGESHYLNGMYTEFEITPTAPLDDSTPVPTQ
jgi:uncharacterized cupredoxin-like copper-binding protein